MDEKYNLEMWKEKNKEFCDSAGIYEQQVLQITDKVIDDLNAFRKYQLELKENVHKVDVNKVINQLARIRNIQKNIKRTKKQK